MRVARVAALLVVSALAGACGPKMIPNTTLEDTADNREILELVRLYRQAYVAKDAATIASLASDDYLDARENISKSTLETELAADFARVRELQLELSVRRIGIKNDLAQVDYFYSTSFLLDARDATWQTETDDKRLNLRREDGGWRVLSGF